MQDAVFAPHLLDARQAGMGLQLSSPRAAVRGVDPGHGFQQALLVVLRHSLEDAAVGGNHFQDLGGLAQPLAQRGDIHLCEWGFDRRHPDEVSVPTGAGRGIPSDVTVRGMKGKGAVLT